MSATPPTGEPTTPPVPGPSPSKRGPELDDERRRFYSRFLGWLLLTIILGYAGLQMPLPWRVVTVVASLAGVIGGVWLLVAALRKRLPALMPIAAILVVACSGFFLLTAGMQVIFWDATATFEECMNSAVTERATSRCFDEYEQDVFNSVPGIP